MAGEIKQKIVLEGEQQYKQAIKDAQRNLKTLRSELKAETAELGRNATEQQKNEAKVKSLKAQIKEQEKIVKANRDALEEVRKKYGDNVEAIAKWEQKLNDSRTALANMKNELDGVGKGFKDVQGNADMATVASKSVADTLGSFAGIADSVSSSIESIFTNVLSKTKEIISEIWGEVMDTAARANSWADMAGMYDTSAANIQKWYHSVSAEGKDFAKVSNMVAKIVYGDNKKIAEAVGISAENYTDKWEYAMAVFDKLATMDHDAQKTALSTMGITGAKEEGWVDVLDAWGAIQGWTPKFDANAGGLGMTDEELDKADRLAKNVETIKTSWMALKDHALISLTGDLALNITGGLQKLIEAFDKYFKAESQTERDQALQEIEDTIIEMFDAIAEAIEKGIEALDKLAERLKDSDNPTAQAVGNFLDGIVKALQWLTEDNAKNVVKALEIIAGFWIAGKGLGFVLKIGQLASNIMTIKNSGILSKLMSGAGGGGAETAAKTTGSEALKTTTTTAAGGGIKATLANMFGAGTSWSMMGGLSTFGPLMAFLAAGYTGWKLIDANLHDENLNAIYGNGKGVEDEGLVVRMSPESWEAAKEYFDLTQDENSTEEQRADARLRLFNSLGTDGFVNTEQAVSYLEGAFENWYKMVDPDGLVAAIEERYPGFFSSNSRDADWYLNGGQWDPTGGNSGEQVTKEDLRSFRNTPEGVKQAVKEGLSNVKVIMDRETIGRLVVDQVSTLLAAGMVSP